MHPSPFQDAITHGEQLFHTGHVSEALQVFESVLESEPQHILALNNKGVILHSRGMHAEAEHAFLDILRHDESNTSAVFNLITMYVEQYNIPSVESIICQYGKCLSSEDICELKEKLYAIQHELNNNIEFDKTKLLNFSMDVHAKQHIVKLYLNERESRHRVICECFTRTELYKPQLANFFASILQENDGFIDIGAHIGYLTLLGASLVGCHGTVLSFEADEKNYRYLRENIALNNFEHVQAFDIALGLENKVAKLFINTDDDAEHAVWNVGRHPDYHQSRLNCLTRDVQVASLDSLLHGVTLQPIKLLNIDANGAEFDIIQGAVSTILDKQVPYVVCGINRFGLQQMGASEHELRQFMSYMGYETYWIQAEAPHLVLLAPEQYVDAECDVHVLFARPDVLAADHTTHSA